MKPFLSIIIPAYNEAKRLPLTLVDLQKHLKKVDYTYEVLVVSDGSHDETVDIVKRFGLLMNNLRVLDINKNRGKGAVVRDGMLAAQGEYRLFMDADNSTSIDQFERLLPSLHEGYDIVVASRYIEGSKMEPPQSFMRRIPSRIGNLIIQALLLHGISDTQCGFKVFSAGAAERIFSKMRITRWGFDVEALALGRKMGYRIKEVPVLWVNKSLSHLGSLAFIKTLIEVFKVRWWLWTYKYKI